MNFRFTVLETTLNRAEFRWKSIRLLQRLAILGLLICTFLLALGFCIDVGWLRDKWMTVALVSLGSASASIGLLVIILKSMAEAPDRQWLATAMERTEVRFLDRLGALLLLEKNQGERRADSFAFRIARQTQQVAKDVAQKPVPFSAGRAVGWCCAFLIALVGLLAFNHSYAPWKKLNQRSLAKAPMRAPEKALEFAARATNAVETRRIWGDVRITEPGSDLKATKIDVVPLQIEAATSQNLKTVFWYSAVNGGEEIEHELPPPSEARYAIYRPTLYLDELNLSDWDVVTYYARARTERTNSYSSDVYFVEVRPFREDIMKMPGGGEGGKPYQAINEMTGLINRQQQVIRQTHQHLQRPLETEGGRMSDRQKLGEAEKDLSSSVQHVYARMAAEMENQPIGDALDNLAKAQPELDAAAVKLEKDEVASAQFDERAALASLVAARKIFQKAVSDHPEAFDQDAVGGTGDQEDSPVADSGRKLQRMAEFRNESRAAQDFLQKMLEKQKEVDQRSRTARLNEYQRLGLEERQLQQELRSFEEQHPKAFSDTQPEAQGAESALNNSAEALRNETAEAKTATQRATEAMRKFAESNQRNASGHQLADAYKLKQMVDEQSRMLERRSQSQSAMTDEQLKRLAEESRQTVDQLKSMAESDSTNKAVDNALKEALSAEKKSELERALQNLARAQDETAKARLSGDASKRLQDISRAFTTSQPRSLQMAHGTDSLKQSPEGSFQKGMQELQSLIQQLAKNHAMSEESTAKQAQQAKDDLQAGLQGQLADSPEAGELMAQLDKVLKSESGVSSGELEKLLESLQKLSAEASERKEQIKDKPQLANINPMQLPPAYRGRIQKYFERLSER